MRFFHDPTLDYRRKQNGFLEIERREVSYCFLYLFRKNSIFRPTSVGHHQEIDTDDVRAKKVRARESSS